MKIDIEIDNLATYAEFAFVLDQENVVERISAIRKSWNIKSFVPYNEFDSWLKEPHIDFALTKEAAEELSDATERFALDKMHRKLNALEEMSRDNELSKIRVIDYEIEYSLRKLNLSINHKFLLLKAIVCDKVKGKDIVEVIPQYSDWLFEYLLFNRETKKPYIGDTKQTIKRDREWYWLHKSGKSYLEIAKYTKDRTTEPVDLYKANVRMQIKRYEQFLGVNI